MDCNRYKSMNEQITPSAALIQSTADKAHQALNSSGIRQRQLKWALAFVVFFLIVFAGAFLASRGPEAIRAGGIRFKPTQASQYPGSGTPTQSTAPEIDSMWVKAYATNGKIGYLYGPELDDEENQPKNPSEAVEYMKRMETAPDRVLNVYAEDKKTVIGVFIIQGGPETFHIEYLAIDSKWIKIVSTSGKKGYVYGFGLPDSHDPATLEEGSEHVTRIELAPDRITMIYHVYAEDRTTIIGALTVEDGAQTLRFRN